MARGNVEKVVKDGAKIAGRLRRLEVTLEKLMAEYHCAYSTLMDIVRSYISAAEWKRIKRKLLARGGVKTRFQKGQTAWNKGLHYNAGGRSAETRFKPGIIRGAAAQRYKPIGTITIRHDSLFRRQRQHKRKDGTRRKGKPRRYIKIKDTGAPQYCWIPYARYLWEQKHGPVPAGFFVVHIDGDQMNDCVENLTIVDRRRHLALQIKRDPDLLIRLRKASGKAAKKRHETNRQMKRIYGPERIFFLCSNCGADYQGRIPPQRCGKCGSSAFEKIKRREKMAV